MKQLSKQQGFALFLLVILLATAAATVTVKAINHRSGYTQIARDQITVAALAQAKDALIGYAAAVQISSSNNINQPRPGDLPCPDTHTPGSLLEGTSSTPCNGNALGRLPWKTLGITDLRDGSNERLWYAVSANFKNNPRSGTLNSDTVGTISVFATDGTIINDGGGSTGAVAVIIAPGDILQRQGGNLQDRSNAGNNTASNYLDIATVGLNTKDNASFTDGSSTFGFIQGRIKDGIGNVILNDQLLVITQDSIMQPIQKRVAGEVKNCLNDYALNNNNRYPWTTPITDLTTIYNDSSNSYFGRIPDDLGHTHHDSDYQMSDRWGTCNTHIFNTPSTWWLNWKEMVFYGLAKNFKPKDSNAPSFPSTCASAGNCLSINNSNMPARFVVIVAGKTLSNPDQANRNSNRSNAFYYLEGGNQNADQSGGYTFTQSSPSPTFNDTVVFQ